MYLAKIFASEQGLKPAIFLQGASLSKQVLINKVSENGALWMPDLGLGVRPRGEPPRMIDAQDLDNLKWNEMPRPKHEALFYLADSDAAFSSALPVFCGSGALLCCFVRESQQAFVDEQTDRWLPRVRDPAFRAHSFYLSLLSRTDLDDPSQDLGSWLGAAELYLRESPEDEAMIVVTSRSGAIASLVEALSRA